MASVKEHYDEVLSDVYSWMFGGFANGVQRNVEFFRQHEIIPQGSAVAVDLGSGCGFQSIPLAQLGFSVTAIDLDGKLLDELRANAGALPITTIQGDLVEFDTALKTKAELVICMTDTIVHLDSRDTVLTVFEKVFGALEAGGRFILTFRDLTRELEELDRFIPVKSDANTIFTCFLEYEPQTVKVHDLVYRNGDGGWQLHKSFYRKLRLSTDWVTERLSQCGFKLATVTDDNGFVTVVAQR